MSALPGLGSLFRKFVSSALPKFVIIRCEQRTYVCFCGHKPRVLAFLARELEEGSLVALFLRTISGGVMHPDWEVSKC